MLVQETSLPSITFANDMNLNMNLNGLDEGQDESNAHSNEPAAHTVIERSPIRRLGASPQMGDAQSSLLANRYVVNRHTSCVFTLQPLSCSYRL